MPAIPPPITSMSLFTINLRSGSYNAVFRPVR
jgi:hypothetical protein